MAAIPSAAPLSSVLHRNLIFVSGKGGVGKSVVSEALACALASEGRRVLWVTFEDPFLTPGETRELSPNLWHLNADAGVAFEEYVHLKIPVGRFAKLFVDNKLMRYLAKAAPGIHELVLLGKVWHERERYDHVVIDMLSTGYGVAMFQATSNFSTLFQGGPIQKDALAMLETFGDPKVTGQLVVSLPEEMPLQEGLELSELLTRLFPSNPTAFLANRCFPAVPGPAQEGEPAHNWEKPLAATETEYARRRGALEEYNLRLWKELPFERLGYIAPPTELNRQLEEKAVVGGLTRQLESLLARPA